VERSRTDLLRRYREIGRALTRHGLGYIGVEVGLARYLPFHRGWLGHRRRDLPYTRADHLRLVLEDLGATFIKLGQILSTRPDLLPPDWSAELAKLQERVPAVTWWHIKEKLAGSLGGQLAHFARIDPEPLAAASIGQVHRAWLTSGEAVVVKVQRPGIREQVQLDLTVLRRLAQVATRRTRFRAYDLPALVEEFAHTLLEELDYRRERRNLERYAREALGAKVRVPKVYPHLSNAEVLTLEYLEGVRVDDTASLKAYGVDRVALAKTMAQLLFRSALGQGFFHADPHPGNFRVTPQGELAVFDFGMMGHLSYQARARVLEFVLAVVEVDAPRATDRLTELGLHLPTGKRSEFERELARFLQSYAALPIGEMPIGDILKEFLALIRTYQLQLPAHLSVFAKTVLMAEGVGVQLDPNFHLTPLVKPLFQRLFLRRYGFERLEARSREALIDLFAVLEESPSKLRRFLNRLEQGNHELSVRSEEAQTVQNSRGLALIVGLCGLSLGLVVGLLAFLISEPLYDQERVSWVLGGGLLTVAGIATTFFTALWHLGRR
jgi:ubiquinone biosynthesis protein